MMKKNTIKKRLFAVFSVVLLLASLALGCISSAWSFTEAPFYNYFDNTKLQVFETYEHDGYISGVNAYTGEINLSFKYDGRTGWWTVPYFETDVTLRDLCPEMIVGETYILGGEYNLNNLPLSPPQLIVLHGADFSMQWNFGEAKVITVDMLNARVTYSFGKVDSNFEINTVYTIYLKLWINKGTQLQEFAPHNLTLPSYEEGYNKGYADGLDADFKDRYILTADNFEMKIAYYRNNPTTPEEAQQQFYILDNALYKFDGFSFNSANLPQGFFANFAPDILNIDYITCTVDLSAYGYKLSDFLAYFTSFNYSASNVSLYFADGSYATYSFSIDGNLTLDGTKLSQIEDNKTIRTLVFDYLLPLNRNSISFSMVLGSTDTLSYNIGFQNGNSDGYSQGLKDGENTGYQKGQEVGYQNGYDYGYERGQDAGYYQGKADEANEGGFFKLFYATLNAPVQVILQMFNFDILGFNVQNLLTSFITTCVVVAIALFIYKFL